MDFMKSLFSKTGLLIVLYALIGIFVNTASPHLPPTTPSMSTVHSWIQYFISIFFWPLSFWHPTFTVGQWMP